MNKYRINLADGVGFAGPCINKFSSGFDTIEFYVDKNFPDDCTYAVVYSLCGDVGMSTDHSDKVTVSTDTDTGKTLVTWTLGREVTCQSGVVIYQVVVYNANGDNEGTAVWYSPQGRIVVGDSIDTTEYETAAIAAEPSLVSQLITKLNNTDINVSDNTTRIDVLEQLQRATEGRIEEIYYDYTSDMTSVKSRINDLEGGMSNVSDRLAEADKSIGANTHKLNTVASDLELTSDRIAGHEADMISHMTDAERTKVEHFFSLYNANGLLNITASEAEETNSLLAEVVGTPCDFRVAFMTGAHSSDMAPYNKLKLLSSYGICDYILNGGGFATVGQGLSVSNALEIAKATGSGVLNLRGDGSIPPDVWANVFCGGGTSYYYIDDMKKNVRIVVLDTEGFDNVQLHWFVKEALRTNGVRPIIVFSHRNLMDFVLKSDGSSLFETIFKFVQDGGLLALTDGVMRDGIEVFRANVSATFSTNEEIIAAIHGNCGVDSCKNDLSKNFCNIGVAEDFADGEARALFEKCDVDIHSDVLATSDIKAAVRATVADVVVGGGNAIEMVPTGDNVETYIVPDDYDVRNVEGYVVIETLIRPGDNVPYNGAFVIASNQSRPISKRINFSKLSDNLDKGGWVRFVVVACRNPYDANYGLYNTYINGVSVSGWHSGYWGEVTESGSVRSEIRLLSTNLTKDSVVYFGRTRVYTSHAMPSDSITADGLGEGAFCYGDMLYNRGCEQDLLKELGADKGCYDVFCIDTRNKSISSCRFGFGLPRKARWVVPDISFE